MPDFKILPTVNTVPVSLNTHTHDNGYSGNSMKYTYSTTTTDSDPGSGIMRFNNATFASITQIFLDDNNFSGTDVQTWLATLDDSSSIIKGYVHVFKQTDPTVFRLFSLTATTEATGYWKLTVAPIITQGTWTNGDVMVVSFSRTGDKGDTGATGPEGAMAGNVVQYIFSNSTTESEPGTDFIRLNHAIPSLVTEIYADTLLTGPISLLNWWNLPGISSTSFYKAVIHLFKKSAPEQFAVYALKQMNSRDSGAWVELQVDFVAGFGSFSNGDVLGVSYALVGGIYDHGALSGNGDNDHPQYMLHNGANTGQYLRYESTVGNISGTGTVTIDVTVARTGQTVITNVYLTTGRVGATAQRGYMIGRAVWSAQGSGVTAILLASTVEGEADSGSAAVSVTAITNGVRFFYDQTGTGNTMNDNSVVVECFGNGVSDVAVNVSTT
jgi:hypothetical protein